MRTLVDPSWLASGPTASGYEMARASPILVLGWVDPWSGPADTSGNNPGFPKGSPGFSKALGGTVAIRRASEVTDEHGPPVSGAHRASILNDPSPTAAPH